MIVERPPGFDANDDMRVVDEANDPYSLVDAGNSDGLMVQPQRGRVGTVDAPQFPKYRMAAGADGETVGFRTEFWEFVRLEISGKWFRASEFEPWRYISKLQNHLARRTPLMVGHLEVLGK